ncbi:MAG: hypothetical protein K2L09_05955 [Alistipes sp.]|nr:hypothetical protein [Alistipes sp.]MDE6375258.1 hypothetical protein [Alistipes sp.]
MLSKAASGFRNNTSGALTNVGANGYCWSSAPQSSGSADVGYLGFNSTNVNPYNSGARSNGLTVRCVQHLREAVSTYSATR